MKFQIIPFRARHVPFINPEVNDEAMGFYYAAEKTGKGYTACLFGEYVGCGCVWINGDEAQVSCEFSPLLKTMPVQLFKACKKGIQEVINEVRPKLLWTFVDHTDPIAVKFAEHMGFNRAKYQIYEQRF